MKLSVFQTLMFFLGSGIALLAQDTILINNKSFENIVFTELQGRNKIYNATLKDWKDGGFSGESPVNVHTENDDLFSVNHSPVSGKYFIGMVTREDGSFEMIYQPLTQPLIKDTKYFFSVFIATSPTLVSGLKKEKKLRLFTNGALLKVLGVDSSTKESETLAQSSIINHEHWIKYDFRLMPNSNYDMIALMIDFPLDENNEMIIGNGNILIDHCSDIIKIIDK